MTIQRQNPAYRSAQHLSSSFLVHFADKRQVCPYLLGKMPVVFFLTHRAIENRHFSILHGLAECAMIIPSYALDICYYIRYEHNIL